MISADESIASAPLPTPETVKDRTSLPKQAMRFAVINARMMKIIFRGHA